MPYKAKGQCVYKKDTGAKVGCTKGSVKDYLAALYMHADDKTDESIKEDIFKGGKADNKTPEDIAQYHEVPVGQIERQLRLGTKIELHHVDSEQAARELAMDHLMEIPDYYDRLIIMQKTAAIDATRNAGVYENVTTVTNKLVGGKGDKMSAKDVAKKHSVDTDKIKDQLKKGIDTEKEHTNDTSKAREIATDHLAEYPNYYDNLKTMEKNASKGKKTNEGIETTKGLIKRLIRENLLKK